MDQIIQSKGRDYKIGFFFFFVFLGLHLQRMEVPKLGVKLELQLPAYATATATPDLSHICNLHHSSQQHQILSPLSETRDQTHILKRTLCGVPDPLSHNGSSMRCFLCFVGCLAAILAFICWMSITQTHSPAMITKMSL